MSIGKGTRLGLAGFIGPLLFGRCMRRKAKPLGDQLTQHLAP